MINLLYAQEGECKPIRSCALEILHNLMIAVLLAFRCSLCFPCRDTVIVDENRVKWGYINLSKGEKTWDMLIIVDPISQKLAVHPDGPRMTQMKFSAVPLNINDLRWSL